MQTIRLLVLLIFAASPALPAEKAEPITDSREAMCLLIESAASANGLPVEYFARLIWQESSFRPDAVGPRTRNGERAEGIAQFMPRTATERGLLYPFNPVDALTNSAQFLRALSKEFGNLGLAAAAYNAGPKRVRNWLSGISELPRETQNYVRTITGRDAEEWKEIGVAEMEFAARTDCRQLMATRVRASNVFVTELQRRVQEGALKPWGVQLNAGFSREHVLDIYASLEHKYRTILANADPLILHMKFRSRGPHDFYQVRVGTDSRERANKLCDALRAAGGACMVLRNNQVAPQLLSRKEN
jgi:hypothetical protein